jgi:2,4-dienoyl-CoA reductase-like NADH-dependent reductase (Old Yellow Enzyme family)/thioredoxin reductase
MFDRLFSPLDIGPVTIKNRIQITPHEQQYLKDGLPSETMINYYLERAKGGTGLLEVSQLFIKASDGAVFPNWETDSARRFPLVTNPAIVPGLSTIADSVHEYGGKIFMELSAWTHLYGPVSAVPFESGMMLNELSTTTISQIQEDFVKGAALVKQSHFDGIDLHGTHGAMIEHFYSPLINRRMDKYGGSLENRLRFLTELIDILRDSVGDTIALGMRLCADEKYEGGVTPEYAVEMSKLLDGKLDFLNVDMGAASQFEAANQHALQTQPLYVETGYGTYMSAPIKKAVAKTKIGIAGRITDPLLADSILEKNEADFVGMTRALIADPYLPNKAKEGHLEDIRPCIGTLQDCWGRSVSREWPMHCTVNPAAGREKTRGLSKIGRAEKAKKILIVGAGPAGLEAARLASERGHSVVIYEKSGLIGGQTNWAKLLPGRVDIGSIVSWYSTQLKKNGVRVELNKEIPADQAVVQFVIDEEHPDAVVVATGSVPIENGIQMITFSQVPGWDLPHVRTVDEVFKSGESLKGQFVVADSTTYIEGPGISEFLVRKGAEKVTLVTPHPHISPELSLYNQLVHVVRRLAVSGVIVEPFSWLRKINENSTVVYNITTGQEQELKSDYVVLNTGRSQVNDLTVLFRKSGVQVFEAGDSSIAGGRIGGAIESGFAVASAL